jgi:hypothetical protein
MYVILLPQMKDERLSRVRQSGEWPFSTSEQPVVVLVMRSSAAHYASIPARLLVNGVRINIECNRTERYSTLRYMQKQAAKYTCILQVQVYTRHGARDSRKGPRFKWQLGRKSQDSRDDSGRRMTAWPGYLANPMDSLDGIRLSEER